MTRISLFDLLGAASALLSTPLGAQMTARQACEHAAGVRSLSDLPRPGYATALCDAQDLLKVAGYLGRGRTAAAALTLLVPDVGMRGAA